MTPAPDSLEAFVLRLPKTEQHLHFEAALPLAAAQSRPECGVAGTPYWWSPGFRYDDFGQFLRVCRDHIYPWFRTPEDYLEAGRWIFQDLRSQNIRYVETSLNLFLLEKFEVDLDDFLRALKAQAPRDLTVRLYLGLRRDAGRTSLDGLISRAAQSGEIAGFDLHGVETLPIEPWAIELWSRTRANGMRNKAHAGEFGPASNVRDVVRELHVDRVQHGVRAIEDLALVRELAERGTVFDVCPLSNVKLKVYDSIAAHPLRSLMAAGIRCTVNSDDPLAFGNSVNADLEALGNEGGFSRQEILTLVANGWREASIPEGERRAILEELDTLRGGA